MGIAHRARRVQQAPHRVQPQREEREEAEEARHDAVEHRLLRQVVAELGVEHRPQHRDGEVDVRLDEQGQRRTASGCGTPRGYKGEISQKKWHWQNPLGENKRRLGKKEISGISMNNNIYCGVNVTALYNYFHNTRNFSRYCMYVSHSAGKKYGRQK